MVLYVLLYVRDRMKSCHFSFLVFFIFGLARCSDKDRSHKVFAALETKFVLSSARSHSGKFPWGNPPWTAKQKVACNIHAASQVGANLEASFSVLFNDHTAFYEKFASWFVLSLWLHVATMSSTQLLFLVGLESFPSLIFAFLIELMKPTGYQHSTACLCLNKHHSPSRVHVSFSKQFERLTRWQQPQRSVHTLRRQLQARGENLVPVV